MIHPMYSIKDRKGEYFQPFVGLNDDSAVRDFAMLINTPGTLYSFAPQDFELYYIGDWHSDNGYMEAIESNIFLTSGDSLVGAKV